MSQTSGLTVRQHEREGIEVPFELTVSSSHAAQVRFSASSSAVSEHVIRGQAIDISSGGMGLRCRQLLPRMSEGIVRVFAPTSGASGEGTGELMFEQKVKVRRVTLTGREPMYSLGVAFIDPEPTLDEQINALFRRLESPSLQRIGAGGGDA